MAKRQQRNTATQPFRQIDPITDPVAAALQICSRCPQPANRTTSPSIPGTESRADIPQKQMPVMFHPPNESGLRDGELPSRQIIARGPAIQRSLTLLYDDGTGSLPVLGLVVVKPACRESRRSPVGANPYRPVGRKHWSNGADPHVLRRSRPTPYLFRDSDQRTVFRHPLRLNRTLAGTIGRGLSSVLNKGICVPALPRITVHTPRGILPCRDDAS
jgi:hypothetical protein